MAEAILTFFAHEHSAGWLTEALNGILFENANAELCRNSTDAASVSKSGTYLPIVNALCQGDPRLVSRNTERKVLIPEALAPFVGDDEEAFPYVLALDYDDYAGRLRAGDQILIVRNHGGRE